jgi:hypothetical protein
MDPMGLLSLVGGGGLGQLLGKGKPDAGAGGVKPDGDTPATPAATTPATTAPTAAPGPAKPGRPTTPSTFIGSAGTSSGGSGPSTPWGKTLIGGM